MYKMIYKAPVDKDCKPYYVPIVTKNKDTLIGYLYGIDQAKEVLVDMSEDTDVYYLKHIDTLLMSTRFNDILPNGRRESDMTTPELQEYLYDTVGSVSDRITDRMKDDHPDNNITGDNVLDVECSCGIGYYSWASYDDVPEETFKCTNCGKVLIDYTGVYDHDINYDYNEG